MKKQKSTLRKLKTLDLSDSNVTLAVVKEYKKERLSHYIIKYVPIDKPLEDRLRNIVIRQIENSNSVEDYTFDCPEPESDQVRSISYADTDFNSIFNQLQELTPEGDIIENIEELIKSKAYLIILRDENGIQVIGFKTIPENWKMKKNKGLIPLLFNENRFKDIQEENIFNISSSLDLFYFENFLFILSKKEFERGLNFREGMLRNAEEMYSEVAELNLFVNIEILTQRVGNNQRYLRKIATIKNLGYYRDSSYLNRLKQISESKGWNIQFIEEQIVITEENLDDILTLLQNKRLHSEITEEDFDVESTKLVNILNSLI